MEKVVVALGRYITDAQLDLVCEQPKIYSRREVDRIIVDRLRERDWEWKRFLRDPRAQLASAYPVTTIPELVAETQRKQESRT